MSDKNKKTLLLVEDEAITAMDEKQQLENIGYSVHHLLNGEDAVQAALDPDSKFDLILMDINLGPGIDGTEAAQEILKHKEIPVVFLSSHTKPEVVEKTEKITSYGYVVKSSSITVLDASIKMALKLYEAKIKEKKHEEALRESEATIRKKLKAITEPEGDIDTLELADIIDYETLQIMMEDFYTLTGIGCAINDVSGKILVSFGWQDICTKFHRVHPDTLKNCLESDIILSRGVPAGNFKIYHCKNNLWDIVTPIMIDEKHLGNIFLGQFFFDDEAPDYELFREQARQYGFDETEYLAALDRVPRFSRETVDRVMTFYSRLAGMISSLSYTAIKLSRNIVQHEHAKERFKESEEQFRIFVENANDIIYQLTPEGVFTFVSPNWTEILGYQQEEVIGEQVEKFVHPDDLPLCIEFLNKVLSTGEKKSGAEYRVKHKDGTWRWHNSNGAPIKDKNGKIISYLGIARDITERKKAEKALQERVKELNCLQALSMLIEKEDILENIFQKFVDVMAAAWNYPEIACARILCEGRQYQSDNFRKTDWRQSADLKVMGKSAGIVELCYLEERPLLDEGPFLKEERNLINLIGERLGRVIERKQAEEAIIKQNEDLDAANEEFNAALEEMEAANEELIVANNELQKAESIVKAEREQFLSILNSIDEAIYISDTDTYEILFVNRYLEKFISQDYIGSKCYATLQGRGSPCEFCTNHIILRQKPAPCKWDFYNTSLNRHYSIVDRIITWPDGREVRFELAIDITERKQAEEALKETKRLLSESQQIGKVGGWEFNIDTLEQKWTEETFRIHEVDLTYDNTVEKGINFYTPDSKPIIENAVQRAIEFAEPYDLELKIITAKGNLRHVHTIGKIDLENRRLFGFFQDITARKIAEENIRHQLSEKETLLKEVHHRIKNSVSQIEGLLRLQANSTDNVDVKTALHDTTSRVQGIRVLYEKLLIGNDYQDVSVKDYIESLIDSLLAVFQESKNITIEKKITDFNMSSKKVIPVGIIINELLTNIFKYAFKGENNNRIFIELDTTDTTVILTIQDNGIGIDKRVFENKSPGFGLTIVKMLAEQLNGTYTIENQNGTKSVLKFEI